MIKRVRENSVIATTSGSYDDIQKIMNIIWDMTETKQNAYIDLKRASE